MSRPYVACAACGAPFSGWLYHRSREHAGPVQSDVCCGCLAARSRCRQAELREEEEAREERRANRVIAIGIGVLLALLAALIVAWWLAATAPAARAGVVEASRELGVVAWVPAAALRAAVARLDGGAKRGADGGAVDAGRRASRSDGGRL